MAAAAVACARRFAPLARCFAMRCSSDISSSSSDSSPAPSSPSSPSPAPPAASFCAVFHARLIFCRHCSRRRNSPLPSTFRSSSACRKAARSAAAKSGRGFRLRKGKGGASSEPFSRAVHPAAASPAVPRGGDGDGLRRRRCRGRRVPFCCAPDRLLLPAHPSLQLRLQRHSRGLPPRARRRPLVPSRRERRHGSIAQVGRRALIGIVRLIQRSERARWLVVLFFVAAKRGECGRRRRAGAEARTQIGAGRLPRNKLVALPPASRRHRRGGVLVHICTRRSAVTNGLAAGAVMRGWSAVRAGTDRVPPSHRQGAACQSTETRPRPARRPHARPPTPARSRQSP